MRDLRQLIRPALMLAAAVALFVNLLPLQVASSLAAAVAELAAGLTWRSGDQVSISLVQRTLVYLPLGLLAYGVFHRPGGRRSAFVSTLLVVAAVGLGAEILQAFVSERHAFLTDFLLVVAVGGLSAMIGEIVVGMTTHRRRSFLQLFVLGNVLALSALLLAKGGADLESWDCSYPLIIGNEATGDRPWHGRMRGLAIFPRALADGEVRSLRASFAAPQSESRREAMGAGVTVAFSEDGTSIDGGNGRLHAAGESQHLEIADGGPDIGRPMLLEVTDGVGDLCEKIKAADAFTIEAEFLSLDLDQRGPARIVTMSTDPEHRNVTLGQSGGGLSLRIRNAVNGDNGIQQQVVTAKSVLSGDFQHWIARYDRGVTTLFVDGAEVPPSLDYSSLILIGGHLGVHLALIMGLISLVIGVAAFGSLGEVKRAVPISAAAAAAGALSLQAAVIWALGMTGSNLPQMPVLVSIGAGIGLGVFGAWCLGLGGRRLQQS